MKLPVQPDAGGFGQPEREQNDHRDQRKGRERHAAGFPPAAVRAHHGRGAGRSVSDYAGPPLIPLRTFFWWCRWWWCPSVLVTNNSLIGLFLGSILDSKLSSINNRQQFSYTSAN